MAVERTLELEQPVVADENANALREATDRAEQAEAELARLKSQQAYSADAAKQPPSPSSATNTALTETSGSRTSGSPARGDGNSGGEDELRKDPMMSTLLDALGTGQDVGHYGRLVFSMVARHFLPHEEVLAWLTKDRDFSQEQAQEMLLQVDGKDYSPPKRERLIAWQAEQSFQFMNPADPDSGNLYRNLKFPDEVYQHIGHYQEAKHTTAKAG